MDIDLVGLAEIAELLGISTRRVDILSRGRDFPEPVASLIGGRVWRRADIEAWAKASGRTVQDQAKPG